MKKIILFLFLISFSFLIAVQLTPDEKKWIQDHPEIKLGVGDSWQPFIFPSEDGNHEGFEADFLDIINLKLGTNITLVPGQWNVMVEKAKNREIDGLVLSSKNAEREKYFNFTDVYENHYYAVVTLPDKLNEFRSEADLKGKTFSYLAGNGWLNNLMPMLQIKDVVTTASEKEAFKLVLEGKTDACFIPLGIFAEMRKIFLDNIVIAHVFVEDRYKLDMVYSIRKDWPELVTIMNKALVEISFSKKNELLEKWAGVSFSEYLPEYEFTHEEHDWLRKHPIIRYTFDPDFPPIEWLNEDGQHVGIAADFLNIIAEQLNVTFEQVNSDSWAEVLHKARIREVDLLPAAAQTPERAEYMLFSKPHLVFPGVIITKKINKSLSSTPKLKHKKVGIVSGYVWHEFIQRDYPEVEIVSVENIVMGLREVATGEIDAMIGTLPIVLYYIEQEGISNLVVAGETEYETRLSIHTRNDWPIFNSIINKALNNISEKERKEIIHNWINLESVSLFANPKFWQVVMIIMLVVAAIVLLFVFWNYSLRRQVDIKTRQLEKDIARRIKIEKELSASEEKYKFIVDNQVDLLVRFDQDMKYTFVSPSYCKVLGKKPEDFLGKSYFSFFSPGIEDIYKKLLSKVYKPPYINHFDQQITTENGLRWYSWITKAVLDDNGNVKSIIALGRDVTEQRQTEKANKQLAEIVRYSHEGVVVTDKDGHIEFVNQAFEEMSGCKLTELMGTDPMEFVVADDRAALAEKIRSQMKVNKRWAGEMLCRCANGEQYYIETEIFPIFSKQKEVEMIVAIQRDISERKRITRELEQHQKNLKKEVKKRTAELTKKNKTLEQMNKLFVGREFRIKALKDKLQDLEDKLKS